MRGTVREHFEKTGVLLKSLLLLYEIVHFGSRRLRWGYTMHGVEVPITRRDPKGPWRRAWRIREGPRRGQKGPSRAQETVPYTRLHVRSKYYHGKTYVFACSPRSSEVPLWGSWGFLGWSKAFTVGVGLILGGVLGAVRLAL